MGSLGKKKSTTSSKPIVDTIPEKGEKSDALIDEVEYDKSRTYEEFTDTPKDGWNYKGTDTDEVEFFKEHSNYEDLIEHMNFTERQAFRVWAQGEFMDGQQYGKFTDMDKYNQELTKVYDKCLDQATLDTGIVVTRRATPQLLGLPKHSKPTLEQLQALRGGTVECKANMSCGAAKHGLTIGHDSEKNIEYVIHIAGGTKGAGMWIGDSRINGWKGMQREFMTNRNSVYAVGRTTEGHDSVGTKVYRVHLYYIGRTEHNYD